MLASHRRMGDYRLAIDREAPWLFTDNDTNTERLFGTPNATPYVKDAFHAAIVEGRADAVDPAGTGTKAAAHVVLELAPGATGDASGSGWRARSARRRSRTPTWSSAPG